MKNNHIYNRLVKNKLLSVESGWGKFVIELHSNLKEDNENVDGVTDFDKKTIKLEMQLSDMTARETIIHEIMHIILESVGLDEKYHNDNLSVTNEYLANTISKQLLIISNMNPKLFETLYATTT